MSKVGNALIKNNDFNHFYESLVGTSYFLVPASYFLVPTSYFLVPSSYFLVLISELQFQSCMNERMNV